MTITTRLGLMDTSELMLPHLELDENDDRRIQSIEYCLLDCPGIAHKTGKSDKEGSFCSLHVHRSAHVDIKRMPLGTPEEVLRGVQAMVNKGAS